MFHKQCVKTKEQQTYIPQKTLDLNSLLYIIRML